jgi:hypothetical protein
MRFSYSTTDPGQSGFDSLPRLPLVLHNGDRLIETIDLVDSGATVNVLPYEVGVQLGAVWDDGKASVRVGGAFGRLAATPFFATAEVNGLPPVKLAFAWIRESNVPLILGQTNFFMEFDVFFYRSQFQFEVVRKSG